MNACKPLCEDQGLTLATLITTDDLTNFLEVASAAGINAQGGVHFSMGLHDYNEGVWTWDDGTVNQFIYLYIYIFKNTFVHLIYINIYSHVKMVMVIIVLDIITMILSVGIVVSQIKQEMKIVFICGGIQIDF